MVDYGRATRADGAADRVVAGQLETDLLGVGPVTSGGGDAAGEPDWVARARAYNAGHPAEVAAFAAATDGAADSASGQPDPVGVKEWQRAHDLRGDGRIGARTVAAASAPASAPGSAPASALALPSLPSSLNVVDLAAYFLSLLIGEDASDAHGARRIVAAGQDQPAATAKPEKAQGKGASGGAKKTAGPKDLVETYGTVDEIKAHDLTERIEVYYQDGLERNKKGGTTTQEKEGIDDTAEPLTSTTPVHKKVAGLFREIFAEIRSSGDWRHILEPPWAYNARQNRNNATEWSIHSFGTAIDINPKTNPNKQGAGATERQKKVATHFEARGFEWLKKDDAMHFQYHEGGAPLITDEEIGLLQAGKPTKGKSKTQQLLEDVRDKSLPKARGKLREAQQRGSASNIAKYQARVARLEEMIGILTGGAADAGAVTDGER